MNPPDNAALGIGPGYRLQWEEAQQCHVLLYPEGMVKLNGPAGEILSLVDGSRSVDDIVRLLEEKFPGVELADDVHEFVTEALKKRWIVDA